MRKWVATVGVIAALVYGILPATAGGRDDALIAVLVDRGYLTAAEGRDLASRPAVRGVADDFRVSGYVHTQFNQASGYERAPGVADPAGTTAFQMRRIFLGVHGRLGSGWQGAIMLNLSFPPGNYVDYVWARRDVDYGPVIGQFTVGYSKVRFGFEENLSARNIAAVERSMVTRYWSASFETNGRLGFGARHVGVFWQGRMPGVEPLRYGFSITNQRANSIGGQSGGAVPQNDLAGFVNVGWQATYADVAVHAGLNFGYKPGGNTVAATAGKSGAILGVNPFIDLSRGRLGLMVEGLISRVAEGRQDTPLTVAPRSTATPLGVNAIGTLKITDAVQAVVRYSHLQTNGRGAAPASILPGTPNPADGRVFDRADALYLGGNWFILGNDLKFSAGYEYAWFRDPVRSPLNSSAYATGIFRARLQALF